MALPKLNTEQVAVFLNRSVQTVERWRRLRIGPPFYRVNGRVLYDEDDVRAWFVEKRQDTRLSA